MPQASDFPHQLIQAHVPLILGEVRPVQSRAGQGRSGLVWARQGGLGLDSAGQGSLKDMRGGKGFAQEGSGKQQCGSPG